ncbi:MAG: PEGA domain-containing protein [Sandaracinaceae bacterium]|nr:PEGA domain-containing protein [Sandaracinaceae bacterium]
MRLRRLELTLAPLLALSGASLAHAQGQPPVYIVSVAMEDGLEGVAMRAGSASRAALRTIEGVDWRSADQRFLGYDNSALNVLDRAREQLEAGRGAYLQLELDQAIEALQGAVDNFDAAAAALEDPVDLGEALLYLGASHAFNGQAREATAVFRRLHIQMPFITPDPNTFPPEVVTMFERARPRDARRPRGVVSMESNPPGAIAYVDFLARGRTPIQVDGLLEGEHVVRVTRPGATPFVETVSVRQRAGGAHSSAYLVDDNDLEGLSEAVDSLRDANIDAVGDGAIRTVAQLLRVEKIGVIRVSSAGGDRVSLELLLFDVRSGRRLLRGEQTYGTAVGDFERHVQQAVGAAFGAALGGGSQATDTESAPALASSFQDTAPSTDGPSTPVTEEAWFWVLIGVLAAGAIAAAIAIPVATSQGDPLGQDRGGQVIIRF